ncbi:MAG TPA: hypothetical protein DGG94_08075 [Micromonosporaceae bacterium]|nr:hypothetical protein [Micromonosporaceae bacterium]HCU49742.1 hypothetical protein [Micromonosporaceae bacterium]
MDILQSLAALNAERTALDAQERQLILAARSAGQSWSAIAEALGLKSRQAAEQRLLRLEASGRRDPQHVRRSQFRQRTVDQFAGEHLVALRRTVRHLRDEITAQSAWDSIHPRAVLVRHALQAAATASPGALYALAGQALADLSTMSSPLAVPLKSAYSAATPTTSSTEP